jgi:hypothetical protein
MMAKLSFAEKSNNDQGLQRWAAFLGQLQSEAKVVKRATTETRSLAEALEYPNTTKINPTAVFQTATCRCSLCSGLDLGTSRGGITSSRIIKVKLTGVFSDEEQQILERLHDRDAEVRRHEQAHLVAAGHYALGKPSYTYQVGPDGRRYAIGGEVQIDLSPVQGDPEATLRKAQQLHQAALAPSNPSAADRQVAAAASTMAQQALQELAEQDRQSLNAKAREAASSAYAAPYQNNTAIAVDSDLSRSNLDIYV